MTKKILLIGGTGTISSSIMDMLSRDNAYEVYVMNRGNKEVPSTVKQIVCDVSDGDAFKKALDGMYFDCVADFIVYTTEQAQLRVDTLKDKTAQYIFISTVVTFDHSDVDITPYSKQENPYSMYGTSKIACEEVFKKAHEEGLPLTIVRPSQTYGYDRIPLSVKGKTYWGVIDRILNDKPVIVHGDGKGIWHMMHTRDFAYNFLPLVCNSDVIGKAFNLVNPQNVTWDEIYHEIARQLNKDIKIVHITSDLLSQSTKYNNKETILGDKQFVNLYPLDELKQYVPSFKIEIDYKEGIRQYLAYMEEHPELKKVDVEFDQWCDEVIAYYESVTHAFHEKF